MNTFEQHLARIMPDGIQSTGIDTLQVNLGRSCNLACAHCHLECSPKRMERMSAEIMDLVVRVTARLGGVLVDITGGEPTLHPRFRQFISDLKTIDGNVRVRTNLTALLQPQVAGMMPFLRDHRVGVVASLPCYLEENVRAQRGAGVYEKSIDILQQLNALGYGRSDDLPLHLVYNPGGAFLPASQAELEDAYRGELGERFGIIFTGLLTIANMPIGRFRETLVNAQELEAYMETLKSTFNSDTLANLMCRRQVCVDWDGKLYDCDFNLSLGWSVNHGAPNRISTFDEHVLGCRRIVTGDHCFGCTAGFGSSCGGALADSAQNPQAPPLSGGPDNEPQSNP